MSAAAFHIAFAALLAALGATEDEADRAYGRLMSTDVPTSIRGARQQAQGALDAVRASDAERNRPYNNDGGI